MRFKSLSLKNYRLFGENWQAINFCEDKNITIIIGNDGVGESAILDAIATQLSVWVAQFPGYSLCQYIESDIHVDNDGVQAPFLNVISEFVIGDNCNIIINRSRKGASAKPLTSNYNQAKNYVENLIGRIRRKEECVIPLVAYYGINRGQIPTLERERNFHKVFSRWDCYKDALDTSKNFKRFFNWFDLMEDEERREGQRRRDFGYQLPALKTVRHALSNFIGHKYKNPRIETKPLRFVVDEMDDGNHMRELHIEQLSDEYKSIITIVADIASRMAEANPDMPNPLFTSGIVLIDEIDLHIPQESQYEFICNLRRTFPNIQFIVTTHKSILQHNNILDSQIIIMDD